MRPLGNYVRCLLRSQMVEPVDDRDLRIRDHLLKRDEEVGRDERWALVPTEEEHSRVDRGIAVDRLGVQSGDFLVLPEARSEERRDLLPAATPDREAEDHSDRPRREPM